MTEVTNQASKEVWCCFIVGSHFPAISSNENLSPCLCKRLLKVFYKIQRYVYTDFLAGGVCVGGNLNGVLNGVA